MSSTTKESLLDIGMNQVRREGFDAVSIMDIVKEAGVPKGSFHYYFDSKEAFGMELLDHFGQYIHQATKADIAVPGLSAYERLRRVFTGYAERMRKDEFRSGCLAGIMALEISDRSDPLRKKANQLLTRFQKALLPLIEQAREEGDIASDLDTQTLARFIANSWQGALIRMKAQKSNAALKDFDKVVFDGLLAKPTSGDK
jgi:TetR/AcrR family transcriptional repressor of nem operon